jgi:exodeoxyribonuclease VII small subunit
MATRKKEEEPVEAQPAARSIEKDIEELELIVKQLEGDALPLEESIALFERGMQLSEGTRKRLAEAETRVEILMKRGSRVEPEPFEK